MVKNMRLIILAAGQGTRLRPLTDALPKCLVKLNNTPLLEWQLKAAAELQIKDICLVGGYNIDHLRKYDLTLIENKDYDRTNMVTSLFCAESYFDKDIVIAYGDIVYSVEVLKKIVANDDPISVVSDLGWHPYWVERFGDPLLDAESFKINDRKEIIEIGKKSIKAVEEIQGQYIGLLSFKGSGLSILKETYRILSQDKKIDMTKMQMTEFLQHMINFGSSITSVPIHSQWAEIDSPRDLKVAESRINDSWFTVSAG